LTFDERVAATALALLEGASPQPVDGLRGTTLDERAVERLHVLPQGRAVEAVLEDLGAWPRSMMRVVVAVVVIVVAVGAAALVSSTGAVSVPAVLVGTLGLQTALLVAWVVTLIPGAGTALRRMLGRLLVAPARSLDRLRGTALESIRTPDAVAEWIGRWRRGAERDHAVLTASLSALSLAYAPKRGVLASLVYGVWSNGAWIAANLLMILVLAVQLLRSRNYTLHSGLISPELSREWIEGVVRVLSVVLPPSFLPDAEAMGRAALEPAGIAADSWRWGTMLLASVVAFGLLPRVVAFFLAAGLLPGARRRWTIPWDDARLAPTRGVIESSAPPVSVVARERMSERGETPTNSSGTMPEATGHAAPFVSAPSAPPAASRAGIVRVGGVDPWFDAGARAVDLGSATATGLDGAEAIARRAADESLAPLILLCALTTAPRLGVGDLLRPLVAAVRGRTVAILTGAARLRRGSHPADLDTVIVAWRRLLEGVGVTQILEVDGSLPTARGAAPLEAMLTGHVVRAAPPGRLDGAVESIVDAAASWGDRDPSGADERRLLDRIGTIYGAEDLSRRAPFVAAIADDEGAARVMARQAREAVERTTGLATLEAAARAADRRGRALRGAVQLSVELEFQGCGETLVTRAAVAACRAWDDIAAERPDDAERRRLVDHVVQAARSAAEGTGS